MRGEIPNAITVTIGGLSLLTAANRVSVPVYVGHTSVADRGTLTTEGTATIQLGGGTTSIYTGYYSGFSAGGVQVTTVSGSTRTIDTVASGFPVQCSILYSDGYVYFNTNASDGAGYCFNVATKTQVWTAGSDTYALGGMACANGIVVFGNDHDMLYVVK